MFKNSKSYGYSLKINENEMKIITYSSFFTKLNATLISPFQSIILPNAQNQSMGLQ